MRDLNMAPYIDSYGLITTDKKDGGDSSHKTAHYALSSGDTAILTTMRHSFLEKGLVRHPDPSKWYSEEQRYSRDQFAPQVIYSALKQDNWLKIFFRKHCSHFLLFAWNTRHNWVYPENDPRYNPNEILKYEPKKVPDLTSPFEFWGFYIRGFRYYLFYPWLFLSDLETIVSAVVKRFDNDCDINNCLAACYLSMKIMPTGLGHIAFNIIKPVLKSKLRAYWSAEKGEPPIGEYWILKLESEGYL